MFVKIPGRQNALSYLLWSWLLKTNGAFSAWLDLYFFGPSHGMNDYNSLAQYPKSNIKPDKLYSILPTVIVLAGDCKNKVVADLGCGTGFFTLPLAKNKARLVFGIDNSEKQLEIATDRKHSAVKYVLADIFVDDLPTVDTFVVPFVINYARTIWILKYFFQKLHSNLNDGGKAVFVIDIPNGKNLKRFGAIKTLPYGNKDESEIQIDLFAKDAHICTLTAVYYTRETINNVLKETGFKEICWHAPIISKEGISVMGPEFWKNYIDDPELGYITATK